MADVVGLFSDLSIQFSLPPLAVAFLAGYGVEAVFSMFDGFIAKFKQAGAAYALCVDTSCPILARQRSKQRL